MDNEGKFEYSPVSRTRLAQRDLRFEVINAPEKHTCTFKMKSNYSGQGKLIIYNAKGDPVFDKPQRIKKGENVTKVDLSRLDKGIYYLHFHTNSESIWSTKVVLL